MRNAIDTGTPEGKLLFNLLAAIAEYEQPLPLERAKAGRELAEKHGKKGPCEDEETGDRMMARTRGVSRATLLKRLDEPGMR